MDDIFSPTAVSFKRSLGKHREHSEEDDQESIYRDHDAKRRALEPEDTFSQIEAYKVTYPNSDSAGWIPPAQEATEESAYADLLDELKSTHSFSRQSNVEASPSDWIGFDLFEFCAYRSTPDARTRSKEWQPEWINELCGLHTFNMATHKDSVFMNGMITLGKVTRFVRQLEIETVSVDGYHDQDCHSVTSSIYVQTVRGRKNGNIYLRLRTPAKQYERYHRPYLWIADFGKYFVDYIHEHPSATLLDFKSKFISTIEQKHGHAQAFRAWLSQKKSTDFRSTVVAHIEYLWRETTDVNLEARRYLIWSQCDPKQLSDIPWIEDQHVTSQTTLVTPYVYELFKNTSFGDLLECQQIMDGNTRARWSLRKCDLGFYDGDGTRGIRADHLPGIETNVRRIEEGDIVGIEPDGVTWTTAREKLWFLYVAHIHRDKIGPYYTGFWLYRPENTTLSIGSHPWPNELFLSDDYNCRPDCAKLRCDDIKCKIPVDWSPHRFDASRYFIRQKYSMHDHSIRTLRDGDRRCPCIMCNDEHDVTERYGLNDTVLVRLGTASLLEPVVITGFKKEYNIVQIRRLVNLRRDVRQAGAKLNELAWTSRLESVQRSSIIKECHIKFIRPGDKVPHPYDRGGQLDCFLITKVLMDVDGREVLVDLPVTWVANMISGSDFHGVSGRLDTLSLFSGGGNFDRGLEESGAIRTRWAIEYDKAAVHTYKANVCNAECPGIFYGSVDEHLARSLIGDLSNNIPAIGKVDGIIAGTCCQSYSTMQQSKDSYESKRNASRIATAAAYIDLYRPRYAIIENVPAMTRNSTNGDNIFCQLLCCLVGIGYQIQQLLLDAWSFGDPQGRPRLFLVATAPGLRPMEFPLFSHAHPPGTRNMNLGKAPNELFFGERSFQATAFDYVSAGEATSDLDNLDDGHVNTCIRYPDHRCTVAVNSTIRSLIREIPALPRAQGLSHVAARLQLPPKLSRWIKGQSENRRKPGSHSYTRVDKDQPFPCITTRQNPGDFKAGYGIHWEQNRYLTLMEARRAQGIPDDEVLVGSPADQWKIVGNSVSRAVALGLGMSLRQALLASQSGVASSAISSSSPHHGSMNRLLSRSRYRTHPEKYSILSDEPENGKGVKHNATSEIYRMEHEIDTQTRVSSLTRRSESITIRTHSLTTEVISGPAAGVMLKHRHEDTLGFDSFPSSPMQQRCVSTIANTTANRHDFSYSSRFARQDTKTHKADETRRTAPFPHPIPSTADNIIDVDWAKNRHLKQYNGFTKNPSKTTIGPQATFHSPPGKFQHFPYHESDDKHDVSDDSVVIVGGRMG